MRPKLFKRVKAGDPITAEMWNDLVAAIERQELLIGTGSGLTVQQGPNGTAIAVVKGGKFLCVANGDISARSGATVGTGSVFLVTLSDSTLATTSASYPVYNPSDTTMTSGHGIDSGQYCLIEEVPSGRFLVTPLECS